MPEVREYFCTQCGSRMMDEEDASIDECECGGDFVVYDELHPDVQKRVDRMYSGL